MCPLLTFTGKLSTNRSDYLIMSVYIPREILSINYRGVHEENMDVWLEAALYVPIGCLQSGLFLVIASYYLRFQFYSVIILYLFPITFLDFQSFWFLVYSIKTNRFVRSLIRFLFEYIHHLLLVKLHIPSMVIIAVIVARRRPNSPIVTISHQQRSLAECYHITPDRRERQ